MPFNGSGVFVSLASPDFPAVAGTNIEAIKFNNNMLDLMNQGLSKCITRNGESPATGNLPMAGFRHTGAGDPVSASDYSTWGKTVGLRGSIGTADWDTLVTTGVFEASSSSLGGSSTNFPPTSEIGQLVVNNQGAVVTHLYIHSGGFATRSKVSGVWSVWVPIDFIGDIRTINVPADYATLQDALDFLDDKVILETGFVTIKMADGTYASAASAAAYDLSHPSGARIALIGNRSTPANVVFTRTASPTNPMLVIGSTYDNGNSTFSEIDGITFTLSVQASGTNTVPAIRIDNGSALMKLGSSVFVTNWAAGIEVKGGSYANVDFIDCDNGRQAGIWVREGSFVKVTDCDVSAYNNTLDNFGSGIKVETGARAYIVDANVTTCQKGGITVIAGGSAYISAATLNSNTGSGLYISTGAVVALGSGVVTNTNTRYGVEHGASFDIEGSFSGSFSASGNTLGAENLSYYRKASGGNFTIGATGGGLILETTNADIQLSHGTGKPRFGDHSAIGAETITGYITIKDANGTERKLAVVS